MRLNNGFRQIRNALCILAIAAFLVAEGGCAITSKIGGRIDDVCTRAANFLTQIEALEASGADAGIILAKVAEAKPYLAEAALVCALVVIPEDVPTSPSD